MYDMKLLIKYVNGDAAVDLLVGLVVLSGPLRVVHILEDVVLHSLEKLPIRNPDLVDVYVDHAIQFLAHSIESQEENSNPEKFTHECS